MVNMLRVLIFLFLGVYAYLASNENSNFSRHIKPEIITPGSENGSRSVSHLFHHKFFAGMNQV